MSVFLHIARIFGQAGTGGRSHCKGIASFILGMAGMPFQPMESHPVPPVQWKETLPQIRIPDLRKPFTHPVVKPAFIDGIHDIGRITPQMNLRIFPLYRLEPLYHSEKFHPVVCSAGEASGKFKFAVPASEDHAISARAGIASGGAVSIDENGRSHSITGFPLSCLPACSCVTGIFPACSASYFSRLW